jgi:rhodanese-related sulfurtransferase
VPEAAALKPAYVTAPELVAQLSDGAAQVVQITRSIAFRDAHLPGAVWAIRGRLAALAPELPADRRLVIVGEQDWQARLAAAELQAAVQAPVRVLKGGLAAWKEAGFPLRADRQVPTDEACIDWYLRPYDRNSGQEDAMRAYLAWEIDLVQAVERDGDARFGTWG